ncbi:MAG: inositol monophosphatase family protein [Planctomycetota bacterium]
MAGDSPSALRDLASAVAVEAGAQLKAKFRVSADDGLEVRGVRDPVTEADRASEALIVERIRAAYPGHSIIGEEGSSNPGTAPDGFAWIVDPLDGTVNFLHGHPFYCVSIGVLHDGEPVAGAIECPSLGEHFAAGLGCGATRNGTPIRVTPERDLLQTILATGFAYGRNDVVQNNHEAAARLSFAARGLRRNGAAAIDLAYVAAGIYGGFWEYWLAPWDVAAGACLVREAGGRVTDIAAAKGAGADPGDWCFGRNIVASNGPLHGAIAEHLEPFSGE